MSNLVNYVKKNKDKDYKEYPFNEIDASIYACLSYIDLTSIYEKNITIKNIYEKLQNRFILKNKQKFNEENKLLLKEMSTSKRYKDNYITDYKKVINKDTQFGAITIVVPKHFKLIAFEGTEDDLVGWEENFKMSYMYPIPAHKKALKYLKENIKPLDYVVYIAGHSKGGNLAMAAAMELNFLKRYQIDYIFNFDGPGFLNDLVNFKKYQKIEKKIINYYPSESIVGMIFKSLGRKKIIKSTQFKVFQHNIHTWVIENNSFKEDKLSNYSQKLHHKLDMIVKRYEKEELKRFISTFFYILNTAGYLYKSDLKKLSLEKLKKLLIETRSLNDEERKLLFDVFKSLIENENMKNYQ